MFVRFLLPRAAGIWIACLWVKLVPLAHRLPFNKNPDTRYMTFDQRCSSQYDYDKLIVYVLLFMKFVHFFTDFSLALPMTVVECPPHTFFDFVILWGGMQVFWISRVWATKASWRVWWKHGRVWFAVRDWLWVAESTSSRDWRYSTYRI